MSNYSSTSRPKVVAIIQARVGSTRFPKKILAKLGGHSLIDWILFRVLQATQIDQVIVAIPETLENQVLIPIVESYGCECVLGSEQDVLARFVKAVDYSQADVVVRICADNPLIASEELDRLINYFLENNFDYAFNHIPKLDNQYPDGLGAEILSADLLKKIANQNSDLNHREHVTSYIWDHQDQYKMGVLKAPLEISYPSIKLDIDTPRDFKRLQTLLDGKPRDISVKEIIAVWFSTEKAFECS